MKKLLVILIFVNLMFISKAFSNEISRLLKFSEWLNVNGYDQYLDKTGDPDDMVLDRSICSSESTWDDCVDANGELIPTKDRKYTLIYPTNLKIKIYKNRWTIPWDAKPNMDTLLYYFYKYQHSHNAIGSGTKKWDWYEANPSGNFFQFKSNLKEDKYIKNEQNCYAELYTL